MMSIESIVALNVEIAAEAASKAKVPYVPFDAAEVEHWPPIPIPNLGYHEPAGWEKTEHVWWVDKTGHGYEWEPALTLAAFLREIRHYIQEHPGDGFAITEEGPCQVYVAAFRPVAA